jgi:hypothetical protein
MAKILLPVIACALLMPMGILTGILHDGGLRETYWGDLGDIEHLILNGSIPEGRPKIPIYALGVPSVTRDWCDKQIKKWYPDSIFSSDTPTDSKKGFLYRNVEDFNESVGFGPSGEVHYFNLSDDNRWSPVRQTVLEALSGSENDAPEPYGLLTRDDALKIATQALQTNPGLPHGYFLDAVHVSVIYGCNYSLIDNYILGFSREWNGFRVIGDRADIVITPIGDILDCQVIWRQVKEPLYTARVVSATEATLYLDAHLPVYFCQDQPEVRVDNVELGYHFGFWDDIWTETRPVWIFNVTVGGNSKDNFYIDALDLTMR